MISVDLLPQEAGSDFSTDQVIFLKGGENEFKVGSPLVEGALVNGKILSHYKGKKIVVFKKKRRKGYRRTQGHRQNYTRIKVTKYSGIVTIFGFYL